MTPCEKCLFSFYVNCPVKVCISIRQHLHRLEKNLRDVNDRLRTFSEQTRKCFNTDSRETFEWWTPTTMTEELHFKCARLNFYCLQAEAFLLKSGFVICFFNEGSNILPMIFHSQPRVEHKLGEKRPVKQNNFTFHKTILRLNTSWVKKDLLSKIISLSTR